MKIEVKVDRRGFLRSATALAAVGLVPVSRLSALAAEKDGPFVASPQFGLVTYMWGADWDLPTLLANCEKTGALGVELRTGHAHCVEPGISANKCREVKQRF